MDKTARLALTTLCILALAAAMCVIVVRNAWIAEDAYITFRSVDNFVSGRGLTWNPGERVQAYTHPLWMFVLSIAYALTREMYYTCTSLSIALSMLAVVVMGRGVARSWIAGILGMAILSFSKAFVDFTTSGLESPLTFFLLAVFLLVFFRLDRGPRNLFLLSLFASLAAVNRPDNYLLCLPCLLFGLVEGRKPLKGLGALALGALPLVLWLGFSLLYYGFPLPNTAYAKLNTGIAWGDLLAQGIRYFRESLRQDPITLTAILAALAGYSLAREPRVIPVTVGVCLYLGYTLRVGGDFMSGRFLAAPLFCSVAVLTRIDPGIPRRLALPALLACAGIGLSSPRSPIYSGKSYRNTIIDENGIADERGFYYPVLGLLNVERSVGFLPRVGWVQEGLRHRRDGTAVLVHGNIGLLGFYSGPDTHIIDYLGLADPLLARLHVPDPKQWRIGHFRRVVPPGYVDTVRTGENRLQDPNLALFYDKLNVLTSGPLWAKDRWRTIREMNAGAYDYLLASYNKDRVAIPASLLVRAKKEHTVWNAPGNIVFHPAGVRIDLGRWSHARHLEVSLDNNDTYELIFRGRLFRRGSVQVPGREPSTYGLIVHDVVVPDDVARRGFRRLLIRPLGGDGMYSVGHLTLGEDAIPAD